MLVKVGDSYIDSNIYNVACVFMKDDLCCIGFDSDDIKEIVIKGDLDDVASSINNNSVFPYALLNKVGRGWVGLSCINEIADIFYEDGDCVIEFKMETVLRSKYAWNYVQDLVGKYPFVFRNNDYIILFNNAYDMMAWDIAIPNFVHKSDVKSFHQVNKDRFERQKELRNKIIGHKRSNKL